MKTISLNDQAAYMKNHPITSKDQLTKSLETAPMGLDWKERIQERFWGTQYQGKLEERVKPILILRDKLLSFGGEEACMPAVEEDLEKIMKRGQFWYGDRITLVKGKISQCHANSAQLWENNQEQLALATGYALSKDGMWRQHSWCIQLRPRKNRVIETTVPRIGYFGFVMTKEEAELFCLFNL